MKLNRYRNEIIVGLSFLLMIFSFFYKNTQVSLQAEKLFEMKQEVRDFKEIIVLKRIWNSKALSGKIDKLKMIVPVSKVKWSKKGKKLTARYNGLTPKELNKVMTKLMSLAVQIIELNIAKSGVNYNMECKCKW